MANRIRCHIVIDLDVDGFDTTGLTEKINQDELYKVIGRIKDIESSDEKNKVDLHKSNFFRHFLTILLSFVGCILTLIGLFFKN